MNFRRLKVKVLICVLTGVERSGWVNPYLAKNLITMSKDSRYTVDVEMMIGRHPVDYARNCCVAMAREQKAEWLMMIDNDQSAFESQTLLDVLNSAGIGKDVIGIGCMQGMKEDGYTDENLFIPNMRMLLNEPPEVDGNFFTVKEIGGGILFLNHRTWEIIPGPWFKWCRKEGSELNETDGILSEDFYFCQLARCHNFKIWVHGRPVPHWKTTNVTQAGIFLETARARARGDALPDLAKLEWK